MTHRTESAFALWGITLGLLVLVGTTLFVGCASNNPSGPASGEVALSTSSTSTTASTTNASATGSISGRIVSASSAGLEAIPVRLYSPDGTYNSPFTTTSDGSFLFNNVPAGYYVLQAGPSANNNYRQMSTIVSVAGGALTTVPNTALPELVTSYATTPTIDLVGVVSTPLSPGTSTLSVAEVTLDTGMRTVTDGFGNFRIDFVASGARSITISKPGMAAYSVAFQVGGSIATQPSIAAHVIYNGATYTPVISTTNGVTRGVVTLPPFQAIFNLHHSGALSGTAKQYSVVQGTANQLQLVPWANQSFQLVKSDNTGRISYAFTNVRTDAAGSFLVDNIPPKEDDNVSFSAVSADSVIRTRVEGTTVIYYVDGQVYNSGYQVQAGQTTIMDFVVPSTAVVNPGSTLPPPDLSVPTDGQVFTSQSQIEFRWTEVAGANGYQVSIFGTNPNQTVDVATNSYFILPSAIGMGPGRYYWTAGTKQTQNGTDTLRFANPVSFLIRPRAADMTPFGGQVLATSQTASRTVNFAWPTVAGTVDHAVFELYDASNYLIYSAALSGSANSTQYVFPPTPRTGTDDTYSWRVRFYFAGMTGSLDTETVTFSVTHP